MRGYCVHPHRIVPENAPQRGVIGPNISAAALSGKFRLGQKFAANAAGLRQGKQLADALVPAGWVERDLIRQSWLGILP
ncbi:hypothetical protein AGR9A_Cc70348 [Agrobacterium salinitolerans str. Hayward 0363]|nr:hypothetical protein AGR9A_Cc70348 [Agrobacterium salinitolerans str. Hayward 0363]